MMVENWIPIIKDVCKIASNIPECASLFINLLAERYFEWLSVKVFPNFGSFMF